MIERRAALLLLACSLTLACALALACAPKPELLVEHTRRGEAALAEGRYAQALAAYSHARELAPADPDVQRGMMQARVHLIAENAALLRPDAIEDARYEALLLLDADKQRAHVYLTALGNVLAKQGDIEGAKLKYAEALKADPASALAHTALGLTLMSRKEDLPRAKAELELALKTKPDAVGALIGLGRIKLAEGDLPGAVDRLEAALRSGDDVEVRMALGKARVQQQRPGDAVAHFQRAAELDPKNPDAQSALGQALLNAGRPEDAERALRAALGARPDSESMIALGFALARQKKSEQALALFGQVLAQDPLAAPALYGAATASEDLGRRDQALEHYRRLLALPTSGQDRSMIADLQRDAQARAAALSAAEPQPKPSGPRKPKAP